MARILINNVSTANDLGFNLQSLGHTVLYNAAPHRQTVKTSEELKTDLFLKIVDPESFSSVEWSDITPEKLDELTSEFFNSPIPVIPVITLNKNSNYSIIKHISATAPHGYLLKHYKNDYNRDELEFIIETALYKQNIENFKCDSDKKTEEALKESEEKFRTFIEQSLDGIVLLDENGLVIEWNKGNEIITGIKKDEAMGKEYWKIKQKLTPPERKSPHHLENIKNLQLEALKTGSAPFIGKIHETDILRPDEKLYYVQQVAFPIKTSKGYRIGYVTRNITNRKQIEAALQKRIIALSKPLNKKKISFHNLFNLKDIQEIQDLFSEATGVSSLITHPDGTPITKPSNFTRLCHDIIRKTDLGLHNCFKSDAIIGSYHPEGPIVMPCLGCGLWDAGASINVGGKHIANWLIGQVRNETPNEDQMRIYASKIGADENEFIKAFHEVPVMPQDQLKKIANVLFAFANQLSDVAYQNVQQASFIIEREIAEKELEKSLHEMEITSHVVMQLVGGTSTQQIYSIIGKAVKELLPDSYVIISAEDSEEGIIKIIECFGLDKYLNKLKKLIGINLYDLKFPINKMTDEDVTKNRSIELTELEDSVYDFVFRKIPKPIFNTIKKLMNIEKIYAVGFSWDDQNFGTLSIVLPNGKSLEHEKTIETIVYQASIALQRFEAGKILKESLEEKKVLLREIHHRVKNNMQIISSLLNLQRQHVDEMETLNVLKESQGRVRSMAMIHENLYQSPSLTKIDFKDYMKKLVANIFNTYGVQSQNIGHILDVEELKLNIETAIPLGLIINELVTNSLKYAFPEKKGNSRGILKIELYQINSRYKLVVSDDGIGLPVEINPATTETLGLQLVNSLVTQIEGTLKIDRTLGTKFTITFHELNYKDRIKNYS